MSIEPNYELKIVDMQREVADGYVFTVYWDLIASYTQNVGLGTTSTEQKVYRSSISGESRLERPDGTDFIPFEELTESIVLQWVTENINSVDDGLGSNYMDSLKRDLKMRIEKSITPPVKFGTPW